MTIQDENSWHLDKRIPIVLIATVALQAAGFIWLVAYDKATQDQRISVIERTLSVKQDESVRIVRLETEMLEVRRSLGRIETQLDRIIRLSQKP